jgi:hypothetical protein
MYYGMARFVYVAVASTAGAVHSATSQPRLRVRGGGGQDREARLPAPGQDFTANSR